MVSPVQTFKVQDQLERPLRSLRLSVTDRCNLRCDYCMPEENYNWLPKADLLSLEEHARLARSFMKLGVTRIRLTGGEPLLRKNLHALVEMLSACPELEDLAMTTNATLLSKYAADLHSAGLQRITVSLDSLEPHTFHQLTRRDSLQDAIQGIEAAVKAGFTALKINMVVLRDVNHGEIGSMLRFAGQVGAEIRFIEYMDVGGANKWQEEQVVSQNEILRIVENEFGTITSAAAPKHAPAQNFTLESGQRFGIIASTTNPFCATCDRSRITADGMWYHCLYSPSGISLREHLRKDDGQGKLENLITQHWTTRKDQGAKERLLADNRGPLIPLSQLKRNPRLEMHTRGG